MRVSFIENRWLENDRSSRLVTVLTNFQKASYNVRNTPVKCVSVIIVSVIIVSVIVRVNILASHRLVIRKNRCYFLDVQKITTSPNYEVTCRF